MGSMHRNAIIAPWHEPCALLHRNMPKEVEDALAPWEQLAGAEKRAWLERYHQELCHRLNCYTLVIKQIQDLVRDTTIGLIRGWQRYTQVVNDLDGLGHALCVPAPYAEACAVELQKTDRNPATAMIAFGPLIDVQPHRLFLRVTQHIRLVWDMACGLPCSRMISEMAYEQVCRSFFMNWIRRSYDDPIRLLAAMEHQFELTMQRLAQLTESPEVTFAPPSTSLPPPCTAANSEESGAKAASDGSVFEVFDHGCRVTFANAVIACRPLNGWRIIATLLTRPHNPVHVMELQYGQPAAAGSGKRRDDPVVDHQGLRAYYLRLTEVAAEMDRAGSAGDAAAVNRLQSEHDFIARELKAHGGLDNRTRRFADEIEAARLSVRKLVNYAINTLKLDHPDLHAHLKTSIKTGIYLEYVPAIDPGWTVRVDDRPRTLQPARQAAVASVA